MFNELRKKPKAVRTQYAFWYAAGITVVVALVWVVSLQYRFDAGTFAGEAVVERETRGAFSQFMGDIKQNFAAVFTSVATTTSEQAGDGVATSTTTTTASSTAPDAQRGFTLTPRATTTASSSPSESKARPVQIEVRATSTAARSSQ